MPRHAATRLAVVWITSATVALTALPGRADAPPAAAPLTVHVSGLHSNDGQVACELYNQAKGYPTDPKAALQSLFCPIAANASTCTFAPIPAGTYAVACFHDENKNGKLDTGIFGIPKEGVGASNGATGTMGPPSFKDAKFDTQGAAKDVPVRIKY